VFCVIIIDTGQGMGFNNRYLAAGIKNFQKILFFLFISLDDTNIWVTIEVLMVRQGVYIYAWLLVSYADIRRFFDKLTVKPKQQRKCSSCDGIRLITMSLKLTPQSGEICVHSALSVRMLESVEPSSTTPLLAFARKQGGDDIN